MSSKARSGGPRYPGWLSLPAVSWYLVFFLVPLGIMAAYSLAEVTGFTGVSFVWNLANYKSLWDPLYGTIFERTLWLALLGTAFTFLLGFPFAYYLARYAQRKTLLLMIVPFWTSFLIRTYSWLIILDPGFWLLRGLRAIGIGHGGTILYTQN